MSRPLAPGERHVYLSTACAHGLHERCGTLQHDRGEPGPPRCKYCPAVCMCLVCDHAGAGVRAVHMRRPPDLPMVG